jgi:hypothetical protein
MVPFSLETGYGITPQAWERLPEMVDEAVGILEVWLAREPIDA